MNQKNSGTSDAGGKSAAATMRKLAMRLLGGIFALGNVAAATAAEVHLYTDRQEVFLRELVAAYEADSGDSVRVLFLKTGLLERAKTEGAASPADVFLVKGGGTIAKFLRAELAAPIKDAELESATANASLRDKDGKWYAITRRVRAIFAAPEITIGDYAELADPKYKNEICIRSGTNGYNIDLFSDLGARFGRAKLKQWLRGVKNNLARKPAGKDRAQINAVADNQCTIGIANSYYYFGLLQAANNARREELLNIKMIIPQDAHINITAMMLARHAKNPRAAKRFMRFLLSAKAQKILADKNNEFPVRDNIEWRAELRPYKSAVEKGETRLTNIAQWNKIASQLVDEIRFDG